MAEPTEHPPQHGEVAARSADGGGSPREVAPVASPLHHLASPSGSLPRAGEDHDHAGRKLGLIAAALIFVADQLTKWIVISPLDLQTVRNIELLPFFDLTWVENRGISLGLFTAGSETARWALVAVTAAIAGAVAWWMWREERRGDQLALGMVLGGALGNIVDRSRFGYVVDFADLHFGDFRPFLVFNVADAAISIGVVILIVRAFLVKDAPKEIAQDA